MKISLLSVIMLSAMSVSAQTMDLPMCLKNLGTTQNKLSEVFREKGEHGKESPTFVKVGAISQIPRYFF